MEKQTAVLTVEEVMQQIGMGRGQVYQALRDGTIPSHRVGKRFVIPKAMFERWMAGEPVHTAAGVSRQRAAA